MIIDGKGKNNKEENNLTTTMFILLIKRYCYLLHSLGLYVAFQFCIWQKVLDNFKVLILILNSKVF